MVGFEVWCNGQKLCVSGIGEEGVLTQILTWSGSRRNSSSTQSQQTLSEVDLHVGGLANNEHVDWLKSPFVVRPGDEIIVRVVEIETADEPVERRPSEREKNFLKRVERQIDATRALLPTPLMEAGFRASLKGLEVALQMNNFPLSVEILGTMGELNKCPAEFWKELLPAALDLDMYEQAVAYREKAGQGVTTTAETDCL